MNWNNKGSQPAAFIVYKTAYNYYTEKLSPQPQVRLALGLLK
jgi:hypothetical protein